MNDQAGESVAVNSEAGSAAGHERENRMPSGLPHTGSPEDRPESRTRGILRAAIHKVMEEIEHHEREAKEHLKQAEALRKDLRESVAFLLEQGKIKEIAGSRPTRAAAAAEDNAKENLKETPASKRRRGRPKKK
jgi:hypothetical protein